MLRVTLKFRMHVVTNTVFVATSKVFLLTFICLGLSQSYWVPSYRASNKSDFVKHVNNVFTETGALDKQECYFQRDLHSFFYQKNFIRTRASYLTKS